MPAAVATHEGSLVIADISGYTTFLTSTELEHSREILSELLETVLDSLKGRLMVAGLEGDAIFFVADGDAGNLLPELRRTFVNFHSCVRDMQLGTTCTCGACSNLGVLTLKFVVHRGRYSRQRVGAAEQVIGADVIVVHRLLKNRVPSHEYVLATAPALGRLVHPTTGFMEHVEEYDLGRVDGAYIDLREAWVEAMARDRRGVEADEARLIRHYQLDAPIRTAWRLLTEAELRQRVTGDTSVDADAGPRDGIVGMQLHCHHGARETLLRFLDAREGERVSVAATNRGFTLYMTTLLEARGARTACTDLYWWEDPEGWARRVLMPFVIAARAAQIIRRSKALARELGAGRG